MENGEYVQDLNTPPRYSALERKPLEGEMPIQNISGPQIPSTVVTMPEDLPVRDHIIWSIFNTAYGNCCCLGLLALVYSVKSRDRNFRGDKEGAASYGSTARSLNYAAIALFAVFILVLFIFNMKLWKKY